MGIELRNVNYKYKNNDKETIKNINEIFKLNSINSIIGVGGSGKSTLVSMLNGQLIQTKGEILIDGFSICISDTDYDKLRFKIGYLYQNPVNQFNNKLVKEEISSVLERYKYRLKDEAKHVKDSLKMVGLGSEYLDKSMDELSQGELKKVALASVLALNPNIIILDEPTISLDNNSKNNLIKIIRILKNRFHKTIILVSNDIDFVHKLSDYIYILSNGKIVKSGNKYEIFTDYEILKKYHIDIPKVINFSKIVLDKKGIKLGYRDEINDLLKDIYRYK